jgi:hypothetical protein
LYVHGVEIRLGDLDAIMVNLVPGALEDMEGVAQVEKMFVLVGLNGISLCDAEEEIRQTSFGCEDSVFGDIL